MNDAPLENWNEPHPDEQTIYIMNAVFEYVQCANDKYIECHRRYAMETERTLHYKDIINMGHAILIEMANKDIELEYNMAEYIKHIKSRRTKTNQPAGERNDDE